MPHKKCPVCLSTDTQEKEELSREDEMLSLVICKSCGHISQDLKDYRDIYSNGEFSQVAREQAITPTDAKIKSLDKKALNRIKYYKDILSSFDNVMEIGSSIGSFIHLLKLQGKKVLGLEPDPNYANFSESQYGFSQESALLEDFEADSKFDAMCSFHVLEHVEEPHKFIKTAHKLLNDNGQILFELPSLELHSYGDRKHMLWTPHIHYFSAASLYQLFSPYFRVLKIGYYGSALFIHAKKSDVSTFSNAEFNTYKRKAKTSYLIAKYFPFLSIRLKSGITAKQLLLQSSVFQENKFSLFKKIFKMGLFAIENFFYLKSEKHQGRTKNVHLSYYSGWENAGDTVLSKCVRDTFNRSSLPSTSWNLKQLTAPVTDALISEINKGQYMLLGGGGVLLPDSNPNHISGWQWAASEEQIDDINVPILLFSIGYNYFHGQQPNELFIKNLKHVLGKSTFFGLRNHGSIREVSSLVGPELAKKISYQPCTTTIIRKLYPELPQKESTKNVAVNIAYDRYTNRFGKHIYVILDEIALSLKKLEERGYTIYNACHLENDAKFELNLDKFNVHYKTVHLQYALPKATYLFYNKMELVMGMRGHAQMIPFGLNCKIISLGSHNKLKWFLEDIDALDWFVDLKNEPNKVCEKILEKFAILMEGEGKEKAEAHIMAQQQKLYDITKSNLNKIDSIIQ